MRLIVEPFSALGFRFEDIFTLSKELQEQALGTLIDGLSRVTPEIRCEGGPVVVLPDDLRSQKTELTKAECVGEIPPLSFGIFSGRNLVGAFQLYGIRIISQTRDEIRIAARPLPAFNSIERKEYAEFALDMFEFFTRNDLTLTDGRTLTFEAIEFSTFSKPVGNSERQEFDVRMELVDQEFELRKVRATDPIEGTKTRDGDGRDLTIIERPSSRPNRV